MWRVSAVRTQSRQFLSDAPSGMLPSPGGALAGRFSPHEGFPGSGKPTTRASRLWLLRLYLPFRWWKMMAYLPTALAPAVVWFLTTACTTLIIPPQDPPNPTRVYIVDVGYHAALILPDRENGIVRYVYGDWSYFALGEDDLWHGLLALLVPTQGALGRQHYSMQEPGELLASRFPGCTMFELSVSVDRVASLLEQLDARFRANIQTRLYNSDYDLEFVKDPGSYIWFDNCNTVLVGWLEELGCECRGIGWYADFVVQGEASY